MVLADILLKVRQKFHFKLYFFHMNYNMHSKSKIMQNYCNDFAFENNVDIFNANIDSNKKFNNTNIEAKARDSRYKELKNICINNNINYIVTAHHEDDQIETIYMCQKNNSSWISKIGIREKFNLFKNNQCNIDVLRPMLSINKKNIIEYAKINKLIFYDDPTNLDDKFLRNKTRLEISSQINDLHFRDSILNISKNKKRKFLKLSNQISRKKLDVLFFSKKNNISILDKKELLSKDIDFFKLMIKEILNTEFECNYMASSALWENLYNFTSSNNTGKKFFLQGTDNIEICISKKYIYIYNDNNHKLSIKVNSLGNYKTRLGTISIMPCSKFTEYKSKDGLCVPYNYINDLKVENWEYGNKCISNSNLTLKVSDIFINNKLSFFYKKNYPIIKYKNNIIWIPNLFHAKINVSYQDKFLILKWNPLL